MGWLKQKLENGCTRLLDVVGIEDPWWQFALISLAKGIVVVGVIVWIVLLWL